MLDIETEYLKLHPTGSRYICDPPVMNTDIDFIVLVGEMAIAVLDLVSAGWKRPNNGEGYGDKSYLTTFRRGEYNLIVMTDRKKFDKWVKATEEAKKKNLTKKEDRVALFESILNPRKVSNVDFEIEKQKIMQQYHMFLQAQNTVIDYGQITPATGTGVAGWIIDDYA